MTHTQVVDVQLAADVEEMANALIERGVEFCAALVNGEHTFLARFAHKPDPPLAIVTRTEITGSFQETFTEVITAAYKKAPKLKVHREPPEPEGRIITFIQWVPGGFERPVAIADLADSLIEAGASFSMMREEDETVRLAVHFDGENILERRVPRAYAGRAVDALIQDAYEDVFGDEE